MSGNTDNVSLWTGADVYIAPTATTAPTDVATAWGAGWDPAGLLDGEEGFTTGQEEESSDFYAWGSILVRRTRSKHKRTIKFVALEDPLENDVVFGLINPGSPTPTTAGGVTTATIKVPEGGHFFAIGFEVRDGDKIKRRVAAKAEVVEVGELKESESEPAVYEVTVVIYPSSDGTLYTELSGLDAES